MLEDPSVVGAKRELVSGFAEIHNLLGLEGQSSDEDGIDENRVRVYTTTIPVWRNRQVNSFYHTLAKQDGGRGRRRIRGKESTSGSLTKGLPRVLYDETFVHSLPMHLRRELGVTEGGLSTTIMQDQQKV